MRPEPILTPDAHADVLYAVEQYSAKQLNLGTARTDNFPHPGSAPPVDCDGASGSTLPPQAIPLWRILRRGISRLAGRHHRCARPPAGSRSRSSCPAPLTKPLLNALLRRRGAPVLLRVPELRRAERSTHVSVVPRVKLDPEPSSGSQPAGAVTLTRFSLGGRMGPRWRT
jgi:hypothetical protein